MSSGLKRFKRISKPVFIVWDSFYLFVFTEAAVFSGWVQSDFFDFWKIIVVFGIYPLVISLVIWVIKEFLLFRGYVDDRGNVKVKDLFTFQVRYKPSVGHSKTKGTSDDEDKTT